MLKTLSVISLMMFLSSASIAQETIKAHALALYGEPKYSEGFERFEYTSPKAQKGGLLKLGEVGTFDTINPFSAKGVPIRNYGLLHSTLMTSSVDEPSTLYGLIAKQVEYDSSQTWITFYLNDKAKFSDGKPITVDDVAFTFEALTTKAAPQYRMYYADVAKVEITSPTSIKFTLKEKNPELLLAVAALPVLPKHAWKDIDFEKTILEISVTSGPYTIEKLEAGRFVHYLRDKNFWAKDLNVSNGIFNFDRIHVDYYRDTDVEFEAFKAGDFDYKYEISSKSWATGYDINAVKTGSMIRLELPDRNVQGVSGIHFNQRKPIFQDLALRKAMTLAFDFEWTNKNIFYGLYARTQSFFQNTEYSASGKPSKEEVALLEPFRKQLPEEVFGDAFRAPETDGSGNNRKNLREAKKILDNAGYKIVDGKLISPVTAQPVILEIIERQKGIERITSPWLANLKRLGITAEIRMMDQTQWINRIQAYDFDMIFLSFRGVNVPGNEQAIYWSSESADTPLSSNYAGIKNPAIDHLVEVIAKAQTKAERINASKALDRVLTHSYYLLLMYYNPTHRIAYWDKFSRPETSTTYDFRHELGLHTWWYDSKKAEQLTSKKK